MVESRSLVQQARDRILRRLARRDLSEAEIREDLRRNFDLQEPDARAVLSELARMGLVDDARLSRRVQRALAERGRGPRWIAMTLRKRGLPQGTRGADGQGADSPAPAGRERAAQWVRKRYPAFREDPKERARALAALARRGFSYAEASDILGIADPDG